LITTSRGNCVLFSKNWFLTVADCFRIQDNLKQDRTIASSEVADGIIRPMRCSKILEELILMKKYQYSSCLPGLKDTIIDFVKRSLCIYLLYH